MLLWTGAGQTGCGQLAARKHGGAQVCRNGLFDGHVVCHGLFDKMVTQAGHERIAAAGGVDIHISRGEFDQFIGAVGAADFNRPRSMGSYDQFALQFMVSKQAINFVFITDHTVGQFQQVTDLRPG